MSILFDEPVSYLQLTNPVNVRLDRVRHLEVDDERNVWHVDTTTCEIGGDKDVDFSGSQLLERGFSLLLCFARVQSRGGPL